MHRNILFVLCSTFVEVCIFEFTKYIYTYNNVYIHIHVSIKGISSMHICVNTYVYVWTYIIMLTRYEKTRLPGPVCVDIFNFALVAFIIIIVIVK